METEHIYSKEEAAELREKIVSCEILPKIKVAFDKYPQLQSAMLLVAQYYNDEAGDAVHYQMIYSVLQTPVWGRELSETDYYYDDPVNLPRLPSLSEINIFLLENSHKFRRQKYSWEENGNAIPIFAAYCQEGCHQEMDYLDVYTPYAVFRNNDEEIEIEVVGNMLRPWLDGLRP
jgi:hypothetical protein